jgi:hypothetical protein
MLDVIMLLKNRRLNVTSVTESRMALRLHLRIHVLEDLVSAELINVASLRKMLYARD